MIKNILFDLGGVIYDIEMQRTQVAMERLLGHEMGLTLFSKTTQQEIISLYEMGKISTADFMAELRQQFGIKGTDAQIAEAWNAILIGVIPGRVAFLSELKQHFNLALLSNTNDLHYEYIYAECVPVYAEMQQCFFSCKMGMRKPNSDIFENTLATLGWKKEETLFVEDSPPNLEGARKIGLPVFPIEKEGDFERFMHEAWAFFQKME
jgi:putative hydrolase of the HAD superfamily